MIIKFAFSKSHVIVRLKLVHNQVKPWQHVNHRTQGSSVSALSSARRGGGVPFHSELHGEDARNGQGRIFALYKVYMKGSGFQYSGKSRFICYRIYLKPCVLRKGFLFDSGCSKQSASSRRSPICIVLLLIKIYCSSEITTRLFKHSLFRCKSIGRCMWVW